MAYVPRTAVARRLLQPRSIVIVGVSPEPGSMGGLVLNNLTRFGYTRIAASRPLLERNVI